MQQSTLSLQALMQEVKTKLGGKIYRDTLQIEDDTICFNYYGSIEGIGVHPAVCLNIETYNLLARSCRDSSEYMQAELHRYITQND